MSSINEAFSLRIPGADGRRITVTAYDGLGWDSAGRVRLTVEVRHAGRVIVPRGQLTCALHGTSDGTSARELVLALVGMKPGDTDRDYFEGYTPAQLEWARTHGETIDCEREFRYCDPETGFCRG
jgi:hypothetical protein